MPPTRLPTAACGAPECAFCARDRGDFCLALARYRAALRNPRATRRTRARLWRELRGRCIPTAANAVTLAGMPGRMGMTVWEAVCKSSGITAVTGGRFHDGGDLPTDDELQIALIYAETSR